MPRLRKPRPCKLFDPSYEPSDRELRLLFRLSLKKSNQRRVQLTAEREARVSRLIKENILRGQKLRQELIERGIIKEAE